MCFCDSALCRLIWSILRNEKQSQAVTKKLNTCDDLHPLYPWATQIHDTRRYCGEWTRFQPKHLVNAMLLDPAISPIEIKGIKGDIYLE